MPRVIGIDPGTSSWDFLGLEDDNVFLDLSVPTKNIMNDPSIVVNLIEKNRPLDLYIAPSGHGIPLKPIKEITQEDIFKANLRKKKDPETMGIGRILATLKKLDVNGYVIPGVKHLSTVKPYYKFNKIDMGTADKVCSAAAAIVEHSKHHGIKNEESNFILVEIGTAFNAILAIENGKIIDGIGGSSGGMGFRAAGSLDSELAYLMEKISKKIIYSGGLNFIAGYEDLSPKELFLLAKKDEKTASAIQGFIHELTRDIFGIIPSFSSIDNIKEIILSGRVVDEIKPMLESRLSHFGDFNIRKIKKIARISKVAAQGAAFIADGLAGGIYEHLVKTMALKDSKDDLLSDIYVGNIAMPEK
ncbi:MAG: DUF1464 family protein [Promethearchaeota archaeon]